VAFAVVLQRDAQNIGNSAAVGRKAGLSGEKVACGSRPPVVLFVHQDKSGILPDWEAEHRASHAGAAVLEFAGRLKH